VDARDVLHRTAAVYASLTSYVDTGMVTTRIAKSRLLRRTVFSTLYQKPSLFRFTFFVPHPHPTVSHIVTEHTVGFDGSESYCFTKRSEDREASKSITSLSLAVAGATGISSGSAHTIGRLLLPEVRGASILDLLNPRFNGDTEIDGIVCYSITAQHPKIGERELWVEKESSLLRKVLRSGETSRSEEVRENISVNNPLELGLFAA
jgi:hypothetical protein